jgi:RIO kinase 1
MSSDELLSDKLLKKLDLECQHILDRSGLDRKTLDQVFDKHTLLDLGKLISDDIFDIIDFPISSGKEANIFRAVTSDKQFIALKIYRTATLAFRNIAQYINGDPRFKHTRRNRRDFVYEWAKKEYHNLQLLQAAGVACPAPLKRVHNILVMDYIGDADQPAPLLKDVVLPQPQQTYTTVIEHIDKMYNSAKLVHADLSAYNILMFNDIPYIIDIGQGVLREHPNALVFLQRDIHNIVTYFSRYHLNIDEHKVYSQITGGK